MASILFYLNTHECYWLDYFYHVEVLWKLNWPIVREWNFNVDTEEIDILIEDRLSYSNFLFVYFFISVFYTFVIYSVHKRIINQQINQVINKWSNFIILSKQSKPNFLINLIQLFIIIVGIQRILINQIRNRWSECFLFHAEQVM